MTWISSFFGANQKTSGSQAGGSPVDIIIYVSTLASDPKATDPILDGLREVTALHGPDRPLTTEDQSKLAEVYRRLEDYLAVSDPLRALDRAVLRQKVLAKFKPDAAYKAFWTASKLQPEDR